MNIGYDVQEERRRLFESRRLFYKPLSVDKPRHRVGSLDCVTHPYAEQRVGTLDYVTRPLPRYDF